MEQIPKLKYHASPLHFMSEPGITQAQYEHMILSGGKNPALDETITVKCPDAPDGTGLIFEVKKSTLIRSPAFARFCESEDYRPGCHMQLTFINDPAVCFQVVVHYLEEGPDRFGQIRLSVFVHTHFKIRDRFILLVRLYHLALKMELPVLSDMSFAVIREIERDMSAGYCITMASLIFARNARFDKRMKEWCTKHIRNYVFHLSQIKEWIQVVPDLDQHLQQQWAKLVEQNKRLISAIHEEMLGTRKDDADDEKSMSSHSDYRRTSAQVEQHIQDLKVEEVIQEAMKQDPDSDPEWEDVRKLLQEAEFQEPELQEPERPPKVETAKVSVDSARSGKAITVHGLPLSKKKIDAVVEYHNQQSDKQAAMEKQDTSHLEVFGPVSSPEVAKARAVMGMNTLNEQVPTKKKRRLSQRMHDMLHS